MSRKEEEEESVNMSKDSLPIITEKRCIKRAQTQKVVDVKVMGEMWKFSFAHIPSQRHSDQLGAMRR